MDAEPRYYVRHYDARRTHNSTDVGYPAFTEIRDRWYCCWTVEVFRTQEDRWGLERTREMRRRAEEACARLNAEHDALLAAKGMASR